MSSRARAAVLIVAMLCATFVTLAILGLTVGPTPAYCSALSTVEMNR